jgi:hypothetical protein
MGSGSDEKIRGERGKSTCRVNDRISIKGRIALYINGHFQTGRGLKR